jgi:hypothetical protein
MVYKSKIMKKYIQNSFLCLFLALMACNKVENKIYFEDGKAPVISANKTKVELEPGLEANQAITFSWTNPDYKFTTGPSSQDVTYTLEMDTVGANFSSKTKYVTQLSKDLSVTYTVETLNGILGNDMELQISPRRPYFIEVRITSSIGNSLRYTSSNIVTFEATPFQPPPKVQPPSNEKLFITGAATPASWMNGGSDDPAPIGQTFTKVRNTLYVLDNIFLIGGGEYLLVPRYDNWSAVGVDPEKYGSVKDTDKMNSSGDEFMAGGKNHKAPAESGNYKIEVNFQTGRTKIIKL